MSHAIKFTKTTTFRSTPLQFGESGLYVGGHIERCHEGHYDLSKCYKGVDQAK